MFCTKCGRQIEDGSKFCTNCGASVHRPPTSPNPKSGLPSYEQLVLLGKLALDGGDYAKARELFRAALDIRCEFAVLTTLATAEKYAGDWATAKGYLERALSLASTDEQRGSVNYNLGNVHRETGRLSEAVAYYRAAIRHRPPHVGTHYNLAQSLYGLGMYDEAIAEYQEVLRLDPNEPAARSRIECAQEAKRRGFGGLRPEIEDRAQPLYQYGSAEANRLAAEAGAASFADSPLREIIPRVRRVLELEPDCEDPGFLLVASDALAKTALEEKSSWAAETAIELGQRLLRPEEKKTHPERGVLFTVYKSLCFAHFYQDQYVQAKECCYRALRLVPQSQQMLMFKSWLEAHTR